MRLRNFSRLTRSAPAALLLALSWPSLAQTNVLVATPPKRTIAKAGRTISVTLDVGLRPGYHVNSNTPSEEFLIPLKLTWTPAPLEVAEVTYPQAKLEKYAFAEQPLSVFTGDFKIVTRFRVPAGAASRSIKIPAKLRYQACTEKLCLPPRTLDIQLPVDIVK